MNRKDNTPNLNLLHLTWPMFIEEMTGGITAFTDTLFISRISDEAAASVGMLAPVLMLGYFILPQFTSAGTSVASQYIGAGRHDKTVPTWVANLLISTLIGSLLTVLLFTFSGKIGHWLGMTPVQNGYAAEYLSVIAFNFILVGARFSYASILASKTLTRWNMIASVTTNLLNIPLNWALMTGWWIFPEMGIRGIALATVISFFVGLLILLDLVHIRMKISFFIKELAKKVREVVIPILKIGIPSALEPFSYTIQNFVVSFLIIGLGLTAMGANTYVSRLIFVDLTVSWVLTMGGQIIMSHHLGAGRIDQVIKTYRKIALLSVGFALANLLVYLLFHRFFLGIFTADTAIIKTGFWILLICLFMEPIRSINILGGVALKTVGDGKFSVIIGLVFMWGLVPVIILASRLGLGIIGLWCCLLADETIRAAINLLRWESGKWKGKTVISTVSPGENP
jgi:putative MATE family efflux protein